MDKNSRIRARSTGMGIRFHLSIKILVWIYMILSMVLMFEVEKDIVHLMNRVRLLLVEEASISTIVRATQSTPMMRRI